MKTVRHLLIVIIFMATSLAFFSCRKNATAPPIKSFAFGTAVTIQQLRAQWATSPVNFKISSNTTLYGVVTADETSGQLYKEVYIRDNSGTLSQLKNYAAISLHFLNSSSGALTQGDSIAINLNGIWLDVSAGGSLQLDSIPRATYPVVKVLASGLNPAPLVATIPQIATYMGGQFIYDGQLVQLNNVQFIPQNVSTTYATPQSYSVNVTSVPPVNVNKYVCDGTGNTIVAYNSGYSNFAGQTIPNNSGTITAISNLYTTMQLSIRSYQDITFNAPYVPIIYDTITQYFDANNFHTFSFMGLSSKSSCNNMAGWQTQDISGNLFWEGGEYGAYPNWSYSPTVSNYKTSDSINDIWLISPQIKDANNGTYSKRIDFSSSYTYPTPHNNNILSVWVSRTFDGTHIIPSQWTNISGPINSAFHNIFTGFGPVNDFNWAHNTTFSSNPYAPTLVPVLITGSSPTFYIAFRYRSNTNHLDSTGCTYCLGGLILKN